MAAKFSSQPKLAAKGTWGSVEYAEESPGSYLAEDYLTVDIYRELGKDDADKVKKKMLTLFQQMANRGVISNPSRFSHESGEIHGFKWNFKNKLVRVACFQCGRRWVLTHGFFKPGAQKKKGTWPKEHIERAEKIMDAYKARKGIK